MHGEQGRKLKNFGFNFYSHWVSHFDSLALLRCFQAHPRRIARVAKQIEREVGSLLIYDKLLQQAVCPERRRGMDGALSALASVTDVQVSNDLQVAKVFLSIYSDDAGKEAAIVGLQRLEGYVRKHVGQQIRLRLTPEIRFVVDDSIERTERVMKLLEQVKKIEAGEAPPPPVTIAEDLEEEARGGMVNFDVVDLNLFEDEDEVEDDDGVDGEVEGPGASRFDGKAGGDMTAEEIEEMMALFRQEGAAKSAGGARRRRK